MKKLLLGVGALMLASTAIPAFAHDEHPGVDPSNPFQPSYSGYNNGSDNGSDNGYRSNPYGANSYAVIRQHVRECRRHEQFHQRLADSHGQAHEDGSADNGDNHADTHGELADEHDQYHDNHGEPQNCAYWYSAYNNYSNSGYRNRHRGWQGWHRRD